MTCRDCHYYKARCMDRFRMMPCRGFKPTQTVQIKPHNGLQKQPQNYAPKSKGA